MKTRNIQKKHLESLAQKKKAKAKADLENIVKENGGFILPGESYKNAKTKIGICCSEGEESHEFKESLFNLKRGAWCPLCKKKENNPDEYRLEWYCKQVLGYTPIGQPPKRETTPTNWTCPYGHKVEDMSIRELEKGLRCKQCLENPIRNKILSILVGSTNIHWNQTYFREDNLTFFTDDVMVFNFDVTVSAGHFSISLDGSFTDFDEEVPQDEKEEYVENDIDKFLNPFKKGIEKLDEERFNVHITDYSMSVTYKFKYSEESYKLFIDLLKYIAKNKDFNIVK